MFRTYALVIGVTAALMTLGCGDDDTGTGGSGGTAGTGGTAGGGGSGGGGAGGAGGAAGCPPPPVIEEVPAACRNSFNQVVSEFTVNMEVALDDCPVAAQDFNANVTPTLALDTEFLQAAADTLCDLGVTLTTVTLNTPRCQLMPSTVRHAILN